MRTIEIGSRVIEISNGSKILFPRDGLTKDDLIEYYRRISDHMVPFLKDRALSLRRFPDGIQREGFYQQQVSDYFPDWIARKTVDKEDGTVTHVVCNNEATLAYLAGQAVITPHAWLSRIDRLRRPDKMIFDLDPPDLKEGPDFEPVRLAARLLRKILTEIGLAAFVMTTGSRGVHIVSPLDRESDFDEVRKVARDIAGYAANQHPDQLTIEHRKKKRRGRLFIDTTRNAYGQTAVPPFAVRARPGAPVATPLGWHELDNGALHSQRYTVANIFRRLGQIDDPWSEIANKARAITDARDRMNRLATA